MMRMMHTLVGYLTTRMIGVAFALTLFIFRVFVMFFHFEGFTRPYHNETYWSCEGIQDAQLHHP